MGNGFVFSIQVVFVEPLSLSPPELHALHRAIMSAKSTPNPVDPAINGSPHIASVANRVLDLIIEVEQESSERVRLWGEWRTIDNSRREWKVAFDFIDYKKWSTWDTRRKREFAMILLSPFKFDEQVLAEFVAEADSRLEQE